MLCDISLFRSFNVISSSVPQCYFLLSSLISGGKHTALVVADVLTSALKYLNFNLSTLIVHTS